MFTMMMAIQNTVIQAAIGTAAAAGQYCTVIPAAVISSGRTTAHWAKSERGDGS